MTTATAEMIEELQATGVIARKMFGSEWKHRPIECADSLARLMLSAQAVPESFLNDHGTYNSIIINMLFCGLWAMSDFHVIRLGHSTASALMTARMSRADADEFLEPPWPAFLVLLPQPLLSVEDDGKHKPAIAVMVAAVPSSLVRRSDDSDAAKLPQSKWRWWWKLATPTENFAMSSIPNTMLSSHFFAGICLWRFNISTQLLIGQSNADPGTRWDAVDITNADLRAELLTGQLVASTCLCFDTERRHDVPGKATVVHTRHSKERRGIPAYTEHHLTLGVKTNRSAQVREYLVSGGRMPLSQHDVSPHWRRVAHGPQHSLRRLQFIESYTRAKDN